MTFSSMVAWLDDERRSVRIFFALTLFIGLLSFTRFGVPMDAGMMDTLGRDAVAYVFGDAEWPENIGWRYHGTTVEFPMQLLKNLVADPTNKLTVYRRVFTEHLATFLIFWGAIAAVYGLAKRRFDSWKWALLACTVLFVSPRVFAHAFYNTRDLPAMSFFAISMFTLVRLSERRTFAAAVVHGIASGAALGIRIPALIIPIITILYLAHDALRDRWTDDFQSAKKTAGLVTTYGASLCVTLFCVWPFLWEAPIQHFLEAYRFMGSLQRDTVLLGKTYPAAPWHYIPLWMFITVPVAYSFFFLLGAGEIIISTIRRPIDSILRRQRDILFLAWFALPIAAILATGAGIYDEWRHVYFLYPAFVLVAVGGVQWATNFLRRHSSGSIAMIPGAVIGVQILATASWMAWNHPMEFAYFSLPSSVVKAYFVPPRADYWGLSYREAMRSLLEENTGVMSVYSPENIAFQNAYNVFPESLGRIMRVPKIDEAMFVLVSDPSLAEGLPVVREITVDGIYLSGIYKGPVKEVIVDRATGRVEFRR